MGSRNLSKTVEKSSSSPRAAVYFSVCLSVHLFHMKTSRIFTRGVFCPSSIHSKYLFLCARRKFGLNKKIRTKLLIDYVYYQPLFCNTHAAREWAQGTFLRQWRKVPPAHAQRVYLEQPIRLPSPHQIKFSVCPFVR